MHSIILNLNLVPFPDCKKCKYLKINFFLTIKPSRSSDKIFKKKFVVLCMTQLLSYFLACLRIQISFFFVYFLQFEIDRTDYVSGFLMALLFNSNLNKITIKILNAYRIWSEFRAT